MRSNIDKEKAKKTVALVLENIRTEADPWMLEEYLGIYKKEVSLFHRSKVAAYLLMLCDQGKGLRPAGRNDSARAEKNARRAGGDRRPAPAARDDGSRSEPQRYPLTDEESRRLFFSVGRSRRVFPREILGLINSKTAIPKEDIGAIRILDNYSFVQVRDTVAEEIIAALNGKVFRGRPLTVNYAKSRKDGENSAAENESEAYADEGEAAVEYARDEGRDGFAESAQDGDPPGGSYPDQEHGSEQGSEQGHEHPEKEDI
ncbi:MAG: DbpA RNA binding domain-containing protein [Treponema sp.]|jgi:hypothetical protein|nr:DbpA RNA binding domain-containing protein [Treponema sp.]